jgi:putative membrane protein
LVDTPLNVEFFKHLPSIITGIGIIGTFIGLLVGLIQFDASGDPANVQSSLGGLLGGVTEAFIGSGVAIGAAMFITWKEKSWLRTCYANLERLTTAIDSLFDSDDVGEQYLDKILQASEQNAKQAKDLKDGLVGELKIMLQNLTDAQQKNSQEMAIKIGQSITDTLQAPLDKIASSVQQVSGDQGTAVQDLLTDVLTAFMNRLETTFGSQMTGMGEMMNQSVSAMREMQIGFNQLIADMRNSSESSAQTLDKQMFNMLSGLEQKQQEMIGTLNATLEHVQDVVVKIGEKGADVNEQINAQVTTMLAQINQKIDEMMTNIETRDVKRTQQDAQRQDALNHTTQKLFNELTEQINRLLQESQAATQSSRNNIEKINQVTTNSITGMNTGAEKIQLAAERFTQAGQILTNVSEKSATQLLEINTLTTRLLAASNQFQNVFMDYEKSRESMKNAISILENVVITAQREAGMSSQLVNDMQKITNNMADYLKDVDTVLTTSFSRFGDGVQSSLNQVLIGMDGNLSNAVNRLSGVINDLSDVAEDFEATANKIVRNT